MSQTTIDVRDIAPDRISPDPDNPRAKLRDIEELAASVKQHGVLDPITVRPDPASNGSGPTWLVVRGHRRHAAALAAGVELMPCIVDLSDDVHARAVTRMVENLQRDDLTAAEEAQGVQQLLDLGISEEEVSAQLSVKPARVRSARAISTSKVLAKGPKTLEMTFDQAAAIVDFETEPKLAKELLATLAKEPEYFDQEVAQARQVREERRAIEEKSAELKAQGYKILKAKPWGYRDDPGYGSKEKPIQYLRVDAEAKTAITTARHTTCPGRSAHIDTDHRGQLVVTEACTDWKANGHALLSSRSSASSSRAAAKPAEMTPAQRKEAEKQTQERRVHLACIKAGRSAEIVRRKFVSDLLARTEAPKGTLAFVVPALLNHNVSDEKDVFCELTGVKKPGGYIGASTVQAKYVEALTEKQLPLALIARVAAHLEAAWEPNTWKGSHTMDQRKAYLRFLVSCGYTPSLIEKVQIGEAKAAQVLAEAERIKAAAKS